jgi:hypothetical protein
VQELGHVAVDFVDDVRDGARTSRNEGEYLPLAQLAMRDVVTNLFLRLTDRRPMRRINCRDVEREELPQRVQVVTEISVGRNHGSAGSEKRRRP